jgi:hypothetical protein
VWYNKDNEREVKTMAINNINNCPFAPTHINGKKIRFVLFGTYAIAF